VNEFALGLLAIALIQAVDDDYKRMYDINETATREGIEWLNNQLTELDLKRLVEDRWIASEDFSDEMIVSSMLNSKSICNGREYTHGSITMLEPREEERGAKSMYTLTAADFPTPTDPLSHMHMDWREGSTIHASSSSRSSLRVFG
jgi:hypothetical protein